MPVSIGDRISMMLRKVPVGPVVRCMKKLESEGIAVDLLQLQAHCLCGGHLDAVTDGVIFAKQQGIDASWVHLCALDLAGQDVDAVLKTCVDTRTVVFSTYRPDGAEPIQGCCSDGQVMQAELSFDFKLPVTLAAPDAAKAALEHVQERLATRASTYIHSSPDMAALNTTRKSHESELIDLATKIVSSAQSVRIEYKPV